MSQLVRLPEVGDRVDGYLVAAEVAHGGMAAVFAARRIVGTGFDKLLALKVLLPHLATEPRFVDMFLDEVRIVSRIHHPNVVQVFDTGRVRGLPYLVMEYLSGQSLSALLRATRPDALPMAVLSAIFADVARGLHGAHETRDADGEPLELVHRDVSPQNVHVSYAGQIKVVDFGIASARGRLTATQTGEVKGKMAYLAPEQVMGRSVDRRTDVWALGVMAFEGLTGERLFRGESDGATIQNILNKQVPDIRSLRADLPEDLAEIVMACLERSPAARPSTAAELAEAFGQAALSRGGVTPEAVGRFVSEKFARERVIAEERIAAAGRSSPPPLGPDPSTVVQVLGAEPTRRPGRGPWVIGGALALLLVLGGAAYVLASPVGSAPREPEPSAGIAVPTEPNPGLPGQEANEEVPEEENEAPPSVSEAAEPRLADDPVEPVTEAPRARSRHRRSPRAQSPGAQSAGAQSPGVQSPAAQSPGVQSPGRARHRTTARGRDQAAAMPVLRPSPYGSMNSR
ncbi:MAG: protein kinase [Myxococcota bacterium]